MKYYRFIPAEADFEALDESEAHCFHSCSVTLGGERHNTATIYDEYADREYTYYETKEQALSAAQEELKQHIKLLESFIVKVSTQP